VRLLFSGLILALLMHLPTTAEARTDHLLLETSEGEIMIELIRFRAPLTVDNIIAHARDGHYDGLVFHRVIEDFVIQTGGYDESLNSRSSEREPVPNESGNGLSNARGTVALARGNDPHSGRAQFYINLDDNNRLDPSRARWGYTVFGRVVAGMDVVDRIGQVSTSARGGLSSDVPDTNIVIRKARLMEREEALDWVEEYHAAQAERENNETTQED